MMATMDNGGGGDIFENNVFVVVVNDDDMTTMLLSSFFAQLIYYPQEGSIFRPWLTASMWMMLLLCLWLPFFVSFVHCQLHFLMLSPFFPSVVIWSWSPWSLSSDGGDEDVSVLHWSCWRVAVKFSFDANDWMVRHFLMCCECSCFARSLPIPSTDYRLLIG